MNDPFQEYFVSGVYYGRRMVNNATLIEPMGVVCATSEQAAVHMVRSQLPPDTVHPTSWLTSINIGRFQTSKWSSQRYTCSELLARN